MKSARLQIAVGVVALAVFLSAVAAAWIYLRTPSFSNRVYRIGWMISPPFQLRGADGKPAGIAVDLVREAARRRGINLQWVFWQDSSESALRRRKVDLWPLITLTPARLQAFHISEPYLEFEHCLLVRSDSPFRTVDDLAKSTVGLANSSIDYPLLHARLPDAQSLARPLLGTVLEDLCRERSAAAFMDTYTAISALLTEGSCAGRPLRWIAVPEVRSRLGIGAPFEDRAAADAIRQEIGVMAGEGKLAAIIGRWGFLSGQHLESMQAVLTARRREARLFAAAALFALLFFLACWQTLRIARERNYSRRTAESLHAAEQKLRLLANNLQEMVLALDMNRRLIYANAAVETFTGSTLAELEVRGWNSWLHPDDRLRILSNWESLYRGKSFQEEEFRLIVTGGSVKWVAATWGPLLDEVGRQIGIQGSAHEITARKLAEEALRESQERFQQAQKLESIGRLAGGVAHDFNNLLTVINGYCEMVFLDLPEGDPQRFRIQEIRSAGARAADLTKQLLAFSRKQVIQPRPLDLNSAVAESKGMLCRLLGEDIDLTTCLSPGLGHVLADAGQIQQVLMNLVVNARDAMPDGGKLVVETAEVEIDSRYVIEHPEATSGRYVLLTVTDNGAGMDQETRRHIFEPFFTTKGPSKGTGLGLATVYGIVKQSHGLISVYTEPGEGTAFRIYLPRIQVATEARVQAVPGRAALHGSETVLLVEDQEEVRRLAISILKAYGYAVLEASHAVAALTKAEQHPGPIHLLLTDVVLPGMNGRELAVRLNALRPDIKVLYTSGYTYDVIAHRGVLDCDVFYIAKPYTPEGLAVKVREVLGPPRGLDLN